MCILTEFNQKLFFNCEVRLQIYQKVATIKSGKSRHPRQSLISRKKVIHIYI
ncbi:hypothetical protein E27107_140063 [Elizabethkingia anophelis]|nr:hypothetical protein E18064_410099 [Elizabethkingia anophelis]CDN76942.1 hypothetical protein E27107_140063 [Elizabethkingia anophelis]